MSSKGRKIAKHIGKSLRKKFDLDALSENDDLQQRLTDLGSSENSSHSHGPYFDMKASSAQPVIQSMGKSTSLSTVNEAGDAAQADYKEIAALAHDMKNFADNLTKLKILFIEGLQLGDEARVVSQESLEEVLSVLKSTLQRYSALQSPEIFAAARALISKIKSHNYEEELDEEELQTLLEAIEGLAITFSTSVSKYLMVDFGREKAATSETKTKSCENLVKGKEEEAGSAKQDQKSMTADEQDAAMARLDAGLDLALARAKVWSRYTRGIITYIEKKSQLEVEYAKNLARITNSMQNSFAGEDYLPLQSVFCAALNQDAEFAANLQATQAVLHTSKFVELLLTRRNEHDRMRKSVKEAWDKEVRKMHETVSNLRKAQAMYISRQQEFERAREAVLKSDSEKLDKRKKLEEETMHKAAEAETTYKACVAEANLRQRALEKTKGELLATLREQMLLCDKDIRTVAVEYFDLLHTVWSPLPIQYQMLSDSSKEYEPGSQYAEFIMRLPAGTSRPHKTEEFMFEPYVPGQKAGEGRKTSVHSNGSSGEHMHSNEGSPVSSPRRDKYRSPVRAWSQTATHTVQQTGGSDTDSASGSSKSRDSSPSSSPHDLLCRKIVSSQSLDELTEEDGEKIHVQHVQERRAQMRRNMTVAGEEALDLPGLLAQGRRNTTFGVDFQEQVERYKSQVPPIMTKCLAEIERRGVMIRGIYRVSGVKSKVESLCQRFDINPELVDLEEVHPNIISNVLKLYLRQLPEPLLTFRLYSDFIHLAKESMSGSLQGDKLVESLSAIVHRLPLSNFKTCAVLMHHLHRVATHSDENQMSSSNLGIVFGPTLLRPLEGTASLASLVDTPHQTRAVELLITNAEALFGPGDNFQLFPDQTPVEAMEDSADGLTISVPSSSTEPSPEKSPAKESTGTAAASGFSPTSMPSYTHAAGDAPPSSLLPEDKILFVSEDEPSSMLEPSAADFSLPGSTTASQEGDDAVFADPASGTAPLGNNIAVAKMVPRYAVATAPLSSLACTQPAAPPSATTLAPLSKPVPLTMKSPGQPTEGSQTSVPVAPSTTAEASKPETIPLLQTVSTVQQPFPAVQPSSAPLAEAETDAAFSVVDSSTWPGPASRISGSYPLSIAFKGHPSTASTTSLSSVSDGNTSPGRDSRADRFKLEQRKLLSAIKSDPKLGIMLSGESGSVIKDVTMPSVDSKVKASSENQDDGAMKTIIEDENKESSPRDDKQRKQLVKSFSLDVDEDICSAEIKDKEELQRSVTGRDDEKGESGQQPEKTEASQTSLQTESPPRGGTKLGTSLISRSDLSAMRSSSSITSKPATASSTKIRTATTSAGQRRANILGLSSTTSAGGVAGSSGVSSGRPVLTRYSSSTNSGVSASSPRRPSGSQATGSTSLSRSSSGPSSSSGHKHSGTVSTSINTSSMRHSFESSLRSYSASSSSSTSSATTDTASALRKGGSSVTRIGASGVKTSSSSVGPPKSIAPSRTSVSGKSAEAGTNSTNRNTVASVPTAPSSSSNPSRKFHEKCHDPKAGETSCQTSASGVMAKGLSQDRTPRFV